MKKNNTNNGNSPNRRGHISEFYCLAVAGALYRNLMGMNRSEAVLRGAVLYLLPVEKGSQFPRGKHGFLLIPLKLGFMLG